MKHSKAIHRMEARLFKAYHEIERLDGECGGKAIMDYELAESLKLGVLEQISRLDNMEGC